MKTKSGYGLPVAAAGLVLGLYGCAARAPMVHTQQCKACVDHEDSMCCALVQEGRETDNDQQECGVQAIVRVPEDRLLDIDEWNKRKEEIWKTYWQACEAHRKDCQAAPNSGRTVYPLLPRLDMRWKTFRWIDQPPSPPLGASRLANGNVMINGKEYAWARPGCLGSGPPPRWQLVPIPERVGQISGAEFIWRLRN